MALTLTAAPRSTVVHVFAEDSGQFTACGRRVGDNWQGEYDEAPTGPVTCKGKCGELAAARQAHLESIAVYRVGERVGILTGYQAVGGKTVGSYGNVVRITEGWNGKPAYVVQSDDGRFVFEAWQLRAGTTNGAMREASMAAHPAGKGTRRMEEARVIAGEYVNGVRVLARNYPRNVTVPTDTFRLRTLERARAWKASQTEEILALLDSSPWDARCTNGHEIVNGTRTVCPVVDCESGGARAPITTDGQLDGARNRYQSRITYRHQG